ncbi:hypothetical protein GF312_00680 [Candidatus Poribacteria bacterium]|nr:hypothetical protein [Candidatus Poribacteria bacterium]
MELESGTESRHLGRIIIDDIYHSLKKHRYSETGKDFNVNFLCDTQPIGGLTDKSLSVSLISPFCENYDQYNQSKCTLDSTEDNGIILIHLPEDDKLSSEIRIYLQTDKYISRKNDGNPEVQQILRNRKDENQERKTRIVEAVKEMLADSEYYINGQKFDPGTDEAQKALAGAMDYLVENTYKKMAYIEHPCSDPQKEIQSILKKDDITGDLVNLNVAENNPRAITEVRDYISNCSASSLQMLVDSLIRDRYGSRPYGWNEWETLLILVKLFVAGEIQFINNNGVVKKEDLSELVVRKVSNWKKLTIKQRKKVDTEKIESVRKLGQSLFSEMGPDKEDALVEFYRNHFQTWEEDLKGYEKLAETGFYPGADTISDGITLCRKILIANENFDFISRIAENRDDLLDFADEYHEVNNFYSTQIKVWDKLRNAKARFSINKSMLDKNPDAQTALTRMNEILEAPEPYSIIKEGDDLINTVDKINSDLLKKKREKLSKYIGALTKELRSKGESLECDEEIIKSSQKSLVGFKEKASDEGSISNIQYFKNEANKAFKRELKRMADSQDKPGAETKVKEMKVVKPAALNKKVFLETEADVDDFVNVVENELKQAIKDGKRIMIE